MLSNIEVTLSGLISELSNEVTRATEADLSLSSKITFETNRATNVEISLSNKLISEISRI